MSNLFQTSAAWLSDKLQQHAGRSVTYTTATGSVAITASPAMHEYTVTDVDTGVVTSVAGYDWIVEAAELVISGSQVEPNEDHTISETLDGVDYVYAVLPIGNRPCCEWLDSSGVMRLVRTKRIQAT